MPKFNDFRLLQCSTCNRRMASLRALRTHMKTHQRLGVSFSASAYASNNLMSATHPPNRAQASHSEELLDREQTAYEFDEPEGVNVQEIDMDDVSEGSHDSVNSRHYSSSSGDDSDEDESTDYDNDDNGGRNDGDDEGDDVADGTVPDDSVPFTDRIYQTCVDASMSSEVFLLQLGLQDLLYRNRASLGMYDNIISLFNNYLSSSHFDEYARLQTRSKFLNRLESTLETTCMQPKIGDVKLHDNSLATVPVFDVKSMILSIVHNRTIMLEENFAPGYDIFTGNVDSDHPANGRYGEVHTGDAWLRARDRYCGTEGKYMPCALILFADKSHTDLHGALSLTPVIMCPTFFNKAARNNPKTWRPVGYIPNLAYGKGDGGVIPVDKVQDEHNCISYVLKSLRDLCSSGGIRTEVMGREVHIKLWIHFIIGDTEGNNKLLGHYQSSNSRVQKPYRDCHCSFDDLNLTNPQCTYISLADMDKGKQLLRKDKERGVEYFKSISKHPINNALLQHSLPLSDVVHGPFGMTPPEALHTFDSGLTMYIFESLQNQLGAGKSRVELDMQHVRLFDIIRRQSERDTPRGAARNGIIDSTRCQSSERKGNLFMLLCIALTVDGELILQNELGLTNNQWKRWIKFFCMYLSMEAWFHDCNEKDEVNNSRETIASVLGDLQTFFPRKENSNGYNLPKMHGATKMQHYMKKFGSAMNFYGGPGEASHKCFVKAPGFKTQRRMREFAVQTAKQYYNLMMVQHASSYVDVGKVNDDLVEMESGDEEDNESIKLRGNYQITVSQEILDELEKEHHNKKVNKYGLHHDFIRILQREYEYMYDKDDDEDSMAPDELQGHTLMTISLDDGRTCTFRAHPNLHGRPWYDWALVEYAMQEKDTGNDHATMQYYPSKILGFVTVHGRRKVAVQSAHEPMDWEHLENSFFVRGKLDMNFEVSFILIPVTAIVLPLCVVPNFGGLPGEFICLLPKTNWGKYFRSNM